jgi:glycosyltransferase involved in cell wall biosynthesis
MARADFSVVICTYNGEIRLPLVLDRLRSQQPVPDCHWEILIVDNNSSDRTASLIQHYQQNWPDTIPLHYTFEPRQGLAYARRRAIQVTGSPLIGFLDDDTLPASDWVSAAYRFSVAHPEVGAYGSEIRGDFEVAPPPNFHQIASCLAIIERGSHPFQYSPRRGVLPAGAGVVVRREAWVSQVPAFPKLAGVCGHSLKAKGEDIETLTYLRQGGWPIWHNPQMKLSHYIPAARLERPYLLHLFDRIGLSRYPLRMLRYPHWQRPGMVILYALSDLRKLVWYVWQTRQLLATDTVTACQRRLLLSSLVSPLYHWIHAPMVQLTRWAMMISTKSSSHSSDVLSNS